MITIGIGMLHREHIRGNESIGTGPTPSPSAPGQHVACREESSSPPVPPTGEGGGYRGRSRRPPPEVVTAECRRRSGEARAAPGRTRAAAPRACGAERRLPPSLWSRRGNRRSEPGPLGPGGGAARHGPRAGETPRRRRRALAERSVDGPARGPAREGQNELEERVLQGISAAGQKRHWVGQGC
jgi:hypothetical protein